jgi:divalent metal cation (Fe/Co/Zn/Cd) transporter
MKGDDRLLRLGLMLEYVTLAWNVITVFVLAVVALKARSVALAAFGLDSLIEIGASLVVIWQLMNVDPKHRKLALRLIGAAFFALAVYVLVQSSTILLFQARPEQSIVGILWLGLTLITMLGLAFGKGRIGKRLENVVLKTEARVTLVDAYLAGSILLGLLLNRTMGWWWADPVAALVIVFYGLKECRQAWQQGDAAAEL